MYHKCDHKCDQGKLMVLLPRVYQCGALSSVMWGIVVRAGGGGRMSGLHAGIEVLPLLR